MRFQECGCAVIAVRINFAAAFCSGSTIWLRASIFVIEPGGTQYDGWHPCERRHYQRGWSVPLQATEMLGGETEPTSLDNVEPEHRRRGVHADDAGRGDSQAHWVGSKRHRPLGNGRHQAAGRPCSVVGPAWSSGK